MIILLTKGLFHNHAPSLRDPLSYQGETSWLRSAGEPADHAPSPRAAGMQSLAAALPGCSAKPARSPLCWGEGGSVYELLQPVANQAPGAACCDGDSP